MRSRATALLLVLTTSALLVSASGAQGLNDASAPATSVSFERATFESVVPYRAWDSRTGPGPSGKVVAGAPVDVLIAGAGSVPADATGAVLNVTVTEATVPSFLSVYPKGASAVSTSSLNFAAGQTVPNLVTVRIGAGGFVSFANQLGAVHVIADVMGYFRPHDHDDRYYTKAQVDSLIAAWSCQGFVDT